MQIASQEGHVDLADAIDRMQYKDGIPQNAVSHMIFSFSGNDPRSLLRKRLSKYKGEFEQVYVGACVEEHAKFVERVFEQVGHDGDD